MGFCIINLQQVQAIKNSFISSTQATLIERGRIIQRLRPVSRECHTCTQKSNFKNRIKNIASIQPALLEMISWKLVYDSSTVSHPDTDQRIRAMFLGTEGLVADLPHLNPGKPGNKIWRVLYLHGGVHRRVTCRR